MFTGISERQIQDYIWCKREKWEELVKVPEFENPDLDVSVNFSTLKLIHKILLDRIDKNIQKLLSTQIFACEVPLEKEGESIIRADFLGHAAEGSGFSIIELKKSKKTERESFTELLGYSGHLVSFFPGLGSENILSILICPLENRIVKESILYSIIVENKPICALIPRLEKEGDISSLTLELWIPTLRDLVHFKGAIFRYKNFRSITVTWEFDEIWNKDGPNDSYKNLQIQNFNALASYTSRLMEIKGLIGFAQCAQIQDGFAHKFSMPNCLTITILNPVEAALIVRLLNIGYDGSLPCISSIEGIDLSFFIPGLEKSRFFDSRACHFSEISDSFDNQISEIINRALELFLLNYPGRKISKEYSSGFTLENHLHIFNPSLYDEYSVYTSGLLREMMEYYLMEAFRIHTNDKNFLFAIGELHWHTVDEALKSKIFLRDFLKLLHSS